MYNTRIHIFYIKSVKAMCVYIFSAISNNLTHTKQCSTFNFTMLNYYLSKLK